MISVLLELILSCFELFEHCNQNALEWFGFPSAPFLEKIEIRMTFHLQCFKHHFTFIQTSFLWLVIKAKTSFSQIPDFPWNRPKIFQAGIRFRLGGIII